MRNKITFWHKVMGVGLLLSGIALLLFALAYAYHILILELVPATISIFPIVLSFFREFPEVPLAIIGTLLSWKIINFIILGRWQTT